MEFYGRFLKCEIYKKKKNHQTPVNDSDESTIIVLSKSNKTKVEAVVEDERRDKKSNVSD